VRLNSIRCDNGQFVSTNAALSQPLAPALKIELAEVHRWQLMGMLFSNSKRGQPSG
jgi:hypothetical protein